MERLAADEQWFQALFETHYAEVQAYCIRRLPAADANDAAAEVFAIAWRKADELPDREFLRAWLFGIARNVIRHSYRSTARRSRLNLRLAGLGTAAAPSAEVQVVRHSEDEELIRALNTMRDSDQEILRLRIWEELSAPEIARLLTISVAAAEKRISRALDRLERAARRASRQTPTSEGGER